MFRTAPVDAPLLVAGAPRVDLTVARVPGQAVQATGPDEAVLFGKVYEVTADGTRTLLGGAVAPMRVPVPADGSAARISVTLPGVVAPIEAGNRLMVSVGTTDQGYAGTTTPAAWRIGVGRPGRGARRPCRARRGRHGEHRAARSAAGHRRGPRRGAARDGGGPAAPPGARDPTSAGRRPQDDPGGTAARPLEIRDLAKTYRGGFSAVHDVSFDVERGMVLGLLGPNGAGKTTVLRMLMGLIRPTAGTIRAFGEPVGAGAPVLARIGAFVEGPGFLPHLSGLDNLRLYWAATGRPTEEAHLDDALEIAGLGGSVRRRVGTYSQGMRQRLAIAQAMLGLPELLVLDEPTNGLDPPQIHAMREVLQRYAAAGRTVLVSSHLLAEVEQTCSHVVVMHQGTVVAGGTVDDIIAGGGAASFTVDVPARAADGARRSRRRARGGRRRRRRARRAQRHPSVVGGARAGRRRGRGPRRPARGAAWKTRSCSSSERTRPDDHPASRQARRQRAGAAGATRGRARPPSRGMSAPFRSSSTPRTGRSAPCRSASSWSASCAGAAPRSRSPWSRCCR